MAAPFAMTDSDIIAMMMSKSAGGVASTTTAVGKKAAPAPVGGRRPIRELRVKSDLFATGAEGAHMLTKYGSGHEHMDTAVGPILFVPALATLS